MSAILSWADLTNSLTIWSFRNPKISENEIISCKTILENKFNTKVTSFAYPFGIYAQEDVQIIKNSSFESAVTTDEGVVSLDTIYELKRVKASGKDNFFAFKLRVKKGFRGFI